MQRFLYGALLIGIAFDIYEGNYLLQLIDARNSQKRISTANEVRAQTNDSYPGNEMPKRARHTNSTLLSPI
jgi:hypothetical protein